MASAGFNLPTSAVNNASAGTSAWTNPTFALTANGQGAQSDTRVGRISNYLQLTGFGFAIPANATIDGVIARIRRAQTLGGVSQTNDYAIQLIVAGSISGNNKATGTNWPLSSAYADADYGGASDKWGLALTPAIVNASNFGLSIMAQGGASTIGQALVDVAWLQVFYSEPTAAIKMHSYRQRRV